MATQKEPRGRTAACPTPLQTNEVYARLDTSRLEFETTAELPTVDRLFAQPRALTAIQTGLGIDKPGYNVYVSGNAGAGKSSVLRELLLRQAARKPVAKDWVYLHNFEQDDHPIAVPLPAGEGTALKKLIDQGLRNFHSHLRAALLSEEYESQVSRKISDQGETQSSRFRQLERVAKKAGFQLKTTPYGIETSPVVDGRVLTEREYGKLAEAKKRSIEEARSKIEPKILDFVRFSRDLEIATREFVDGLQDTILVDIIAMILAPVREKFAAHPSVLAWCDQCIQYVAENRLEFIPPESVEDSEGERSLQPNLVIERDATRKFRVNLFVSHKSARHAPVVFASNPNYFNLFGKIERNIEHGVFYSDVTMVKPGLIHEANGGYLVLQAADVFRVPHIWETLKRMLRSKLAFIEDVGDQMSMFPASGLRPQAVSLEVKIFLVGSDEIYHYLTEVDDDFGKLFKIKADFDIRMRRNAKHIKDFSYFIASRCKKEQLRPLDREGFAATVEFASRMVEDQHYLTTQYGVIKDLLIEADFWASHQGASVVSRQHVVRALRERESRVNLAESYSLESFALGDSLMTFSGETIGQVNALTVYEMGDHSFGKPVRVTCTTSVSDDGILHVDRATKLSGNVHDKGVLILSGFLSHLLTRRHPLGLAATLCFEQSYSSIDGDSATMAELVAAVSSMARIPVYQNFAITGSLNQLGEVQPVGGVNEKIEGFVAAARTRSRDPQLGVVIPKQTVRSLMLGEVALEMVAQGRLHIYPVTRFSEAFELMTGITFGARSAHVSRYPRGSALAIIEQRLQDLEDEERGKGGISG